MRLFVLFIKSGILRYAQEKSFHKDETLWLLDDVCNELDESREKLFFEKLLLHSDQYILTTTKNTKSSYTHIGIDKIIAPLSI
jgi:recombinational DNA repair ATPase RecF